MRRAEVKNSAPRLLRLEEDKHHLQEAAGCKLAPHRTDDPIRPNKPETLQSSVRLQIAFRSVEFHLRPGSLLWLAGLSCHRKGAFEPHASHRKYRPRTEVSRNIGCSPRCAIQQTPAVVVLKDAAPVDQVALEEQS